MTIGRRSRIALAMLFFLVATNARADDRSKDPEALLRKTFDAGIAAFTAGRYDEALRLFRQAYRINPTANVMQNLAQAELETGHPVEAAQHFFSCLHAEDATDPMRKLAREGLQQAERRVGKLRVDVNVDGAEVFIDGEGYGAAPLTAQTAYVAPGRHVVVARKDGFTEAKFPVEVLAGQTVPVTLKLEMHAANPNGETSASRQTAVSPSSEASAPSPVAREPMSPTPPIVERRNDTARSVVLWTGAGITAGAFALAFGFAMKASTSASSARRALDDVDGRYLDGCSDPRAALACNQAFANWSDHIAANRVANYSLLIGGLAGVTTVGAFFLWRPSRSGGTAVVPQPTRDGWTLSVVGEF